MKIAIAGNYINPSAVMVIKSTVPVGYTARLLAGYSAPWGV